MKYNKRLYCSVNVLTIKLYLFNVYTVRVIKSVYFHRCRLIGICIKIQSTGFGHSEDNAPAKTFYRQIHL